MRVGVILASLGRPDDLEHVIEHLQDQTVRPDRIVLSLEKPSDAPPEPGEGVEVVYGPKGLCAQRNRGLDRVLSDCDVVVFFDDDFVPCRTSLEGLIKLFQSHPDVAGATGRVLADGVVTGGVPYEEAQEIVAAYDRQRPDPGETLVDVASAYGCNMAFRASAIRDLRFDERLPLYGWQEDVDFAGRLRKRGRMVKTGVLAGVHCGVTRSRMPGKRLGYSQVVNPIYLVRKGSMGRVHAYRLIAQNLIANHLKSLRPERHIDRLGRACGNWIGLSHVLRGRIDPMAVLEL